MAELNDPARFGAEEDDLILMPTRAEATPPTTEDIVARLYREQAEVFAAAR